MSDGLTLGLAIPPALIDVLVERVAAQVESTSRWRDVPGLARAFDVPERTIRDWRERGLPARRVGKRLMFSLEEVEAWLDTQERV